MYYLPTFTFQHRTPPLFYHYHSLLELQKHHLCPLSSYLLSIHLDLPECIVYIHSLLFPESVLFFSISFTVPYHHTNFNPRKLEFNPEDSRAKITKFYPYTVPYIIHHTTPSQLIRLLNTINDSIYSTPLYLSIPFQFISIKTTHSNFPSLKTCTTSSLIAVPFISYIPCT